ncbi:MAG: chromosome partitioning protein ParA [Lachnospiraceae bacterium]|nr:chromosome partitioning protein ParA [Lachnospiraceae bacterium]
MKIRLAILEGDKAYLERITTVFNTKYINKLEIYCFTDKAAAMQSVKSSRIDVFLANESFGVDKAEIPQDCGFAYLIDASDIKCLAGITAICKFQKVEMIYRQILDVFSEKATDMTGILAHDENSSYLTAFLTAGGGTGSSVAAAACAMNFAQKGRNTLYLNLERFGSADAFFNASGDSDLGDIIYAIKSKKANLSMKLESLVKQDSSGVFFFSPTKMALDITELTIAEAKQIISILRLSGTYNHIILDLDFSLDKRLLSLLEDCNSIVFVTDGSQVSNIKLERALRSLEVLEQQGDTKILQKSGILYNRFSSHTSRKIDNTGLKEYGGISRFEGFDTQNLLQQLKTQAVFEQLEQEALRQDDF